MPNAQRKAALITELKSLAAQYGFVKTGESYYVKTSGNAKAYLERHGAMWEVALFPNGISEGGWVRSGYGLKELHTWVIVAKRSLSMPSKAA